MNALAVSFVFAAVACSDPSLNMGVKKQDFNMGGKPPILAVADTATAKQPEQVKKKRVMHFYGPSWCPNCPGTHDAVKKALGEEFDIEYLKDYGKFPEWVLQQGQKADWGYPMIHWKNNSGAGAVSLWAGLENFRVQDGPAESTTEESASAPTPGAEVERVIGLLPKPAIGFVDFGCGDGRWCIAAAERWGCRVTGVEIDPARAASTRERIKSLGLSKQITIITGDATTTEVEADVGVAYLYADVLEKLRPRAEKLAAFASYKHRPPGMNVSKNGGTWFYFKPQPQPQTSRAAAEWGGQLYTQPVCDDPGCAMCRSIRRQLNYGIEQPSKSSIWSKLF